MKDRVLTVAANVFDVPLSELNESSSPDTVEAWDSLKHMNLVLALEEEFGVQFSDEQVMELLSVELIVETLRELGA